MINIICVGKLKDKYLIDMSNDYLTRLTKYHKINVIELKDSNIKEEGELILKHLNPKDYIITMEINGNNLSSVELSNLIDKTFINYPSITFIIGGSDGIDDSFGETENLVNFYVQIAKMLGDGKDGSYAIERLTLERLYFTFTLDYQANGHALYTTSRESGLYLAPQNG